MGIAEIRETIESCRHCFMCRHACPTFLATKLDSHTPRGYALLLSEIDHGLQNWTPAIVERFYQCSQCGLCREDCAYHWAEDEVVRVAREEIVRQGRAPRTVTEIAARIAEHGSPYPDRPDLRPEAGAPGAIAGTCGSRFAESCGAGAPLGDSAPGGDVRLEGVCVPGGDSAPTSGRDADACVEREPRMAEGMPQVPARGDARSAGSLKAAPARAAREGRAGAVAAGGRDADVPREPGMAVAAASRKKRDGVDILYFAGCSARRNHPEIPSAVGRILQAMRADWTVLPGEACCGMPLFELGCTEQAAAAARRTAEAVLALKPKILLTGCPHCLRAFRELYPRWEIEWPGELRLLHTAQLIAERMDRGELRLRAAAALPRLAYHDPCQLARKLGEYEAPRRVLAAIGGRPPLELFHDREKAECCGAGSAMFLTDPDIALRVARNRLSSALETEAGMLVTACQNCKNVLGRAGDGASRIRVADICEVAAELL